MKPKPLIPPLSAAKNQSVSWSDLRGYVAVVAPFCSTSDQCSIQCEGREFARLILCKGAKASSVLILFLIEPEDATLVAIGRTIRAHQRAFHEQEESV